MGQTKVTGREVSDKSIFFADIDLTTAALHPNLVASDRFLIVDPTDGEIKTSTLTNLYTVLDARYSVTSHSHSLTNGVFEATGLLYAPYTTQPSVGSTPSTGVFFTQAVAANSVGQLRYSGTFMPFVLSAVSVFAGNDMVYMGAYQNLQNAAGLLGPDNDELIAVISNDTGVTSYHYANGAMVYNADTEVFSFSTSNLCTNLNADMLDDMHGSKYRPIVCFTSTAAATVAKVITISNYTLTAGDILAVTFTAGNSASAVTLNINNTGAKNVRFNGANVTTTTMSIASLGVVMMYYDGTYFQMIGSQRTSDSDTYNLMYWGANQTAGAAIYSYKLVMQGADGKWYPLTVETGTGTTKTVQTTQLMLNSLILHYPTTTTVAANGAFSYLFSDYNVTTLNYTANQASWTNQLPLYIKATVNANGTITLANATYTSFLTQTLPTTEDGFIYIFLGVMTSTTGLRLTQYHPIYQYVGGRLRLYQEGKNISATDMQVLYMSGTSVVGSAGFMFDATLGNFNAGVNSSAGLANSIAIGPQATAYADGAIAIGRGADCEADDSICIGSNANSFSQYGIAIGIEAAAGGIGSVAIGRSASPVNNYDIMLGSEAYHGLTTIHGSVLLPTGNLTINREGPSLWFRAYSGAETYLSYLASAGNINFYAYNDGSYATLAASIAARASLLHEKDSIPTELVFSTANLNGSATERMIIRAGGMVEVKRDLYVNTSNSSGTQFVINGTGISPALIVSGDGAVGVNTTSLLSTLSIGGSTAAKSRSITTANQTLGHETFAYINAGTTNLYLVSAITAPERMYIVANIGGGAVTVRLANATDSLNGIVNGTFSIKIQGLTIIQQGAGLSTTGWYAYELR